MKNHKEMFEALLSGKRLVIGTTELFLEEGELYRKLHSGDIDLVRNTSLSLKYHEDWKIKPETIEVNGFNVPKPKIAPQGGRLSVKEEIHIKACEYADNCQKQIVDNQYALNEKALTHNQLQGSWVNHYDGFMAGYRAVLEGKEDVGT